MAIERALGTGIIISSSKPIPQHVQKRIRAFVEEYEHTLSRFRADSLVSRMACADDGGDFEFPEWAGPLFTLYSEFYAATHGAFDACIGADLLALGYNNSVQFVPKSAASASDDSDSWSNYRRALPVTWGNISRDCGSATLRTNQPVQLDFGAAGKGYFVDLVTQIIKEELSGDSPSNSDSRADFDFLVNAGGDMRACFSEENNQIKVALENPFDTTQAVAVASIASGALCASSSARRRWKVKDTSYLGKDASGFESNLIATHLINALDGIPACDLCASWAYVPSKTCDFPTAYADALATALFVSQENNLQKIVQTTSAEFAVMLTKHALRKTRAFPAHFFAE
ncbi:FAD:protein FMN transferase [Gardnerella sp. KA00390]|uniref:FAD:protein FMN transferase n=1 Tax=Gardnerella vaginalis TaxID=2702 RepID=A0AAW6Y2U5_GARVA|nr:FAD:protein FMN transferase [Gardnerella vaginalis]MDK6861343.1 FAD:protein FMN transferase [Gardnerella vaginalis]MDK7063455.1 FAD:protein FMN transferase [Gardnerella vaginalis]